MPVEGTARRVYLDVFVSLATLPHSSMEEYEMEFCVCIFNVRFCVFGCQSFIPWPC